MTIGQVAAATGISASAIRFYESARVLPVPRRKSGIRQYDASIIEQIKIIRYYRSAGVAVETLASMFSAGESARSEGRREAVVRRITELRAIIEQARTMKQRLEDLLQCQCEGDSQRCVIFTSRTQPTSPTADGARKLDLNWT